MLIILLLFILGILLLTIGNIMSSRDYEEELKKKGWRKLNDPEVLLKLLETEHKYLEITQKWWYKLFYKY